MRRSRSPPRPSGAVSGASLATAGGWSYSTDDTRANVERLSFDPQRREVSGSAVELTRGAQAVDSAEPSPDGRSIVFDNLVPQEDLFVMNALGGGGSRQLTNDRFKDRRPTWSPDGKLVLFYSNRSGRYEAWTLRPDGGGLQQVTNTEGGSLTRPDLVSGRQAHRLFYRQPRPGALRSDGTDGATQSPLSAFDGGWVEFLPLLLVARRTKAGRFDEPSGEMEHRPLLAGKPELRVADRWGFGASLAP